MIMIFKDIFIYSLTCFFFTCLRLHVIRPVLVCIMMTTFTNAFDFLTGAFCAHVIAHGISQYAMHILARAQLSCNEYSMQDIHTFD
jgi:hypothetical protein